MVVFLVVGRPQAETYSAVSQHLDSALSLVFADSGWVETRDPFSVGPLRHLAEASIGRLTQLLRVLERLRRQHPRLVLVTGQDIGTPQRVALTWAKRRRVTVALIPDGVAFSGTTGGARDARMLGRLRAWCDQSGILVGDPGRLGGSDPAVILSWGEAWHGLWRTAAPTARIIPTGAPRMDALASAAGDPGESTRLLLCSQPLWQAGFSASEKELDRWYGWLVDSARACADIEVRVRFHPAERGDPRSASAVRELSSIAHSGPVCDALSWATHVIAPASTISLEAAALGRKSALVAATPSVETRWSASPLFRDSAWARVSTSEPLYSGALDFAPVDVSPFMANVGRAGQAVGEVLTGLL